MFSLRRTTGATSAFTFAVSRNSFLRLDSVDVVRRRSITRWTPWEHCWSTRGLNAFSLNIFPFPVFSSIMHVLRHKGDGVAYSIAKWILVSPVTS